MMKVGWSARACAAIAVILATAVVPAGGTTGQERFSTGQNVVPAFEGWEQNGDGTFNLVFGYLNRNYEEQVDIPIGPNNQVEPGGPDQGQPTHFFPRRLRFVFKVKAAKGFGKRELVWTLVSRGKTERAYATLKPEYVLEPNVTLRNNSGDNPDGTEGNKAPTVRVEGDLQRTVKAGEPLELVAFASDDGVPKPQATPRGGGPTLGYRSAYGLRVAWFVYRGAGNVTFDPEQFKVYHDYKDNSPWTPGWMPPPLPPDGRFPVRATFSAPGTYVIRVMAHDGGLQDTQDVTVTVVP